MRNGLITLSALNNKKDIGLLILRIAIGIGMTIHGAQKIFGGLDDYSGYLSNLGFPMPYFFAILDAVFEFFGGLFVAIGFLTRYLALLVAATMLVALATAHAGDILALDYRGFELAYLYFFIYLGFFFVGGGKYSLDGLLFKIR